MSSDDRRVERILDTDGVSILALIVRSEHRTPGISFVTEDESDQQLGVLCWERGHRIDAHVHNRMHRTITSTQEVLFVRRGKARLDLYTSSHNYSCSREVSAGDVVLLHSGGHGLEMLEDTEIIEVKQGPYLGEHEKTRFAPSDNPFIDDGA